MNFKENSDSLSNPSILISISKITILNSVYNSILKIAYFPSIIKNSIKLLRNAFQKTSKRKLFAQSVRKNEPIVVHVRAEVSSLSPKRTFFRLSSSSSLYSLRQIIRESQVKIFQNHGHLIVALSKRIIIFPHS